jgi:hypothetical protein
MRCHAVVSHGTVETAPLWGIGAEFASSEAALAGARAMRDRKFGRLDILSPVPLAGAADVLDLPTRVINPFALAAVLLGGAAMMGLCLYATGFDYVFNIGGRPRFSWPAFVIPSFSFAMMAGAVIALLMMLFENRLPRLNHPTFNIPAFSRVSQDRYFLLVEAGDGFDPDPVERALQTLTTPPLNISRVPR